MKEMNFRSKWFQHAVGWFLINFIILYLWHIEYQKIILLEISNFWPEINFTYNIIQCENCINFFKITAA